MEENFEETEIVGNPNKSCVLGKPGYDKDIDYIRGRILALGLEITDEGWVYYTKEAAERHYIAHKGRHYYNGLIDYITSGSVYFMNVQGKDARFKIDNNKKSIREAVLAHYPDLSDEDRKTRNVIHATDIVTDADYELGIGTELLNAQRENENTL